MVKTRRMMQSKLDTLMKHYKIRKCTVKVSRLNLKSSTFKNALFKMYDIRDFRIQLHRLENKEATSATSEKKRFLSPNLNSVRLHVPWLPTIASVTSSVKINESPKPEDVAGRPGRSVDDNSYESKPQQAKLSHVHRQGSLSDPEERQKPTNEDIHSELLEKLNSPNRSLLPANLRPIPDSPPKVVPEHVKIFEEFQEKMNERRRAQRLKEEE